MHKALVVLPEGKLDDDLHQAVKTYSTGTDVEVVLCRVIDENEYRSTLQRKAQAGEEADSIEELQEAAQAEAARIGDQAFEETDSYSALGLVGSLPEAVLSVSEEQDYDHVFISGRKRSPTGKVLFGDLTQSVILNFDGPVTVTLQEN